MRTRQQEKVTKSKKKNTKLIPNMEKYSPNGKAKRKLRLNKWKQILLEYVLQLLGDPRFNNVQIQNDLMFFQDMDLAIFGSPPDEYKMYANQLQKEYVRMDENTYKSMRLKILSTFLMIPNIYSTESFRNRFEDIARTNINNEILELKK